MPYGSLTLSSTIERLDNVGIADTCSLIYYACGPRFKDYFLCLFTSCLTHDHTPMAVS
jgi:hypothetical protein